MFLVMHQLEFHESNKTKIRWTPYNEQSISNIHLKRGWKDKLARLGVYL